MVHTRVENKILRVRIGRWEFNPGNICGSRTLIFIVIRDCQVCALEFFVAVHPVEVFGRCDVLEGHSRVNWCCPIFSFVVGPRDSRGSSGKKSNGCEEIVLTHDN